MHGEIRSFRDLRVWQRGMRLVTDVYRITGQFPREEAYGLTSQMRRCAVSIPSNIAEGYGRRSTNDYVRFLRMACGSLYELQTQIEIAVGLEYLDHDTTTPIALAADEIGRMLGGMIGKLDHSSDGTRNDAENTA